jgi:hypothetical protein
MIRTDFLNLPAPTRPKDREAIRRAELAKGLFGGPASSHGRVVNFNAGGPAPVKARNTTGGVMDLYQGITRSDDEVRRSEIEERMGRLPVRVQRLATDQGITDIELLQVIGAVVANSNRYGGERVQLFSSDLARALGVSTQKADALLDEAVRRGFIEACSRSIGGGYFRPRI